MLSCSATSTILGSFQIIPKIVVVSCWAVSIPSSLLLPLCYFWTKADIRNSLQTSPCVLLVVYEFRGTDEPVTYPCRWDDSPAVLLILFSLPPLQESLTKNNVFCSLGICSGLCSGCLGQTVREGGVWSGSNGVVWELCVFEGWRKQWLH